MKSEFYIPTAVQSLVDHAGWRVQVLHSDAQWLGVTYREDRDFVAAELFSRHARQSVQIEPAPVQTLISQSGLVQI